MDEMKPNAASHNPDPAYLRGLLDAAGLSQRKAAELLGISDRVMRYYLSDQTSDKYGFYKSLLLTGNPVEIDGRHIVPIEK